ncbi:MAG: DUF5683 domain-containing protein [Gemmatimonadota bacterium]
MRTSPRGAFLRALALPGWGHASIGSYTRGGFYFVVEGATAFALVQTRLRLLEARRRLSFTESVVRRELVASGVTDPMEVQDALDGDPRVEDARALEESRAQQQEDWIAFGLFALFLSGADAYVSAHLKNFPAPLNVNVEPGTGGRMEFSLALSVP